MSNNTTQHDTLDDAKEMGKSVLKDRIISNIKNAAGTKAVMFGGLAAGTALGMKKGLAGKALHELDSVSKKALIKKSLINEGLNGMAAGSVGAGIALPAMRLHEQHKKEFGTAPDLKDYAKLESTTGIPNAAYWALALKNRHHLEKGISNAADAVHKYKQTKDLKALKGVSGAMASGGAMAIADQASDALGFVNTPETIIAKKKKEREEGANMTKSALNIIDEAFDKQASIQDSYLEKEASSFMDVLKGKNVETADKLIRNFDKVKEVGSVAEKIPGFVERTVKPHAKNIENVLDNNQFLRKNDHGAYQFLDDARRKAGLDSLDDAALSAKKRNAHGEHDNVVNEIDNISKNFNLKTEGKGTRMDDILHGRKYRKNQELNQKRQELVNRIKNGEDLTLDEKEMATRTFGSDFGKELRSGKLRDLSDKVKNTKSEVKKYTDEDMLRRNKSDIEKSNKPKNIIGDVKNVIGEGSRIIKDFDNTFTVNGKVPSEGLQRLRNQEAAKTTAARTVVGAGALGAGALGVKALSSQSQPQQSETVNPYKFRNTDNFSSQRSVNRQPKFPGASTNFDRQQSVNKVAEEIVIAALEK